MCRLIFFCGFLSVMTHGSFVSYNRSYDQYTYILPLELSTNGTGQVTFKPRTKDSSSAQRWCQSAFNGSKLATITSETIQKNINDFIAGAKEELKIFNITDVRVGGKSQNGWKWINGKILRGYQVANGYYRYGALGETNKRFVRRAENSKMAYICQYSLVANSRHSCQFNDSGRCYSVRNSSANWTEARNLCIKEGGDLASLDIYKDINTLQTFMQRLSLISGWYYWVGLKEEMFWFWIESDSEMNYTNWRFGQTLTTGQCVALYYPNEKHQEKGKWTTSSCSDRYPFICEIRDDGTATTASTEVLSKSAALEASDQGMIFIATIVALSICLTISMIVTVALIVKHHIGQTKTASPPIRDNTSSSAAASKTESKQATGSSNCFNNDQGFYANYATDKSSTKRSAHAASGPQSTMNNSYVDDQQQQSTIYASVQDQGGSSGPRVKEDVTSSAAATDTGRLIYSELEFIKQPTK